jgi:hypothetical protein
MCPDKLFFTMARQHWAYRGVSRIHGLRRNGRYLLPYVSGISSHFTSVVKFSKVSQDLEKAAR